MKYIIPAPKPRKPRDPVELNRIDAIKMFGSATGTTLIYAKEILDANFADKEFIGHLELAEIIRTYYEHLLSGSKPKNGGSVPLRQARSKDDFGDRTVTQYSSSNTGRYSFADFFPLQKND